MSLFLGTLCRQFGRSLQKHPCFRSKVSSSHHRFVSRGSCVSSPQLLHCSDCVSHARAARTRTRAKVTCCFRKGDGRPGYPKRSGRPSENLEEGVASRSTTFVVDHLRYTNTGQWVRSCVSMCQAAGVAAPLAWVTLLRQTFLFRPASVHPCFPPALPCTPTCSRGSCTEHTKSRQWDSLMTSWVCTRIGFLPLSSWILPSCSSRC